MPTRVNIIFIGQKIQPRTGIMNTTSDSQNLSQRQNTTIQITKDQLPQPEPSDTNNSGNPPICKDFLNGKCSRPRCKYLHVITLYKPTEQKPILNQLFIPGKGHVFINLTNFARLQQYNGLFLCNLGDIIHTGFLDKLFASSMPQSGDKLDYFIQKNMRAMITNEVITSKLAHKMQKVIEWTLASNQLFEKTNYSTIFIYDISNSVSNWVLKSKLAKHNNTWIMKYILNCLNMLFTCIYERIPQSVAESINLYVSYLNDELNLTNRGSLDFIYGLATATPGKYIGNYFNANIYYLGALPNLDEPISNPVNTGFVYCYLTRTKYINLADILTIPNTEPSFGSNTEPRPSFGSNNEPRPSFGITWQGDIQTGNNINEYNTELSKHNTLVYQNLFEKNSHLKTALSNTIPISNIRPKSLVIIGCNLDVEFDRGLVAGLKETVGAIDFASITSKHGVGNVSKNNSLTTSSTNNSSQSKKTSDSTVSSGPNSGCCNDDTPTTTTMSVIMPIFGGGNSSNSQQPSATQLNEMMRDLLGGMFTGKLSGNSSTTRPIQNRVCTIGINLIRTFADEISTNQPFDTIIGIDKIKEYGADPTNKIIILCSPRMTHEFFSDFIKQLTHTPGYPARISANFIDFAINPCLRKCLAYHNYRMMRNSYNSSLPTEVPITQMCRLHRKFMNYLNSITPPCSTVEKHGNLVEPHKNTIPNECCTCCSCLSRNGIGYTRFGHLPYVPLEQLNKIKDDSWLPRY